MPQIDRKWPKIRFFCILPSNGADHFFAMYRWKMRMRQTDTWLKYFWRTPSITFSFFGKKPIFFCSFSQFLVFGHLIVVLGGAANPFVGHISAIWGARRIIFSRSSSVWLSGPQGIPVFVFARHHSELVRGTKKWKFKIIRSGRNFQISRMAWRELRKVKSEKKKFFFGFDCKFFFFIFFSIYRIVSTENWSTTYDSLFGGWGMNRASSRNGIAGGW